MDYIRYGLIICLVAVGLFIAKQWAEFSDANQIASSVSSQQVAPTLSEKPVSNIDDDDIPRLNYNNTGQTDTLIVESTSQEDYITVNTPTLSLKISKTGGDIIYAVLPEYKTSLKDDLGPFTIFEKSAKRVDRKSVV